MRFLLVQDGHVYTLVHNRSNFMSYERHKCVRCKKLTRLYQRVNGSPWHCYDGCYSTTGKDWRTVDGTPLWKKGGVLKPGVQAGAAGLAVGL